MSGQGKAGLRSACQQKRCPSAGRKARDGLPAGRMALPRSAPAACASSRATQQEGTPKADRVQTTSLFMYKQAWQEACDGR